MRRKGRKREMTQLKKSRIIAVTRRGGALLIILALERLKLCTCKEFLLPQLKSGATLESSQVEVAFYFIPL